MTARQQLDQARHEVKTALASWDSTNLAKIERCQAALQCAAEYLRSIIDSNPSTLGLDDRSETIALQEDARKLIRIVDASSAFQKGLVMSLGQSGEGYSPTGHTVAVCEATATGVEA